MDEGDAEPVGCDGSFGDIVRYDLIHATRGLAVQHPSVVDVGVAHASRQRCSPRALEAQRCG